MNKVREATNGVQDGHLNAARFDAWQRSVEDFKPFVLQGALSVSRVARECGLNRDVFYTNREIRESLWPALIQRLETEGVLRARVASPAEAIPRPVRTSTAAIARTKQIQEENELLKAENRELRKQLDRLGGIEEVLNSTGRLPW